MAVLQVMGVHSAIVNDLKEIDDVSNKEMLELMEITDKIRQQIGEILISFLPFLSKVVATTD